MRGGLGDVRGSEWKPSGSPAYSIAPLSSFRRRTPFWSRRQNYLFMLLMFLN